MSENRSNKPGEQGELRLACPECRRVVSVHWHKGFHLNRVDKEHDPLADLRACGYCGKDMVEVTDYDEQGRPVVPESVKGGT